MPDAFSSEHSQFVDPLTGAVIHQMTDHPGISHPTYFLQSSFTPDSEEIFFTSYRCGAAQLYIAEFPGGDIRQLTEGAPIHPYSPALSPCGSRIFYVSGGGIHWVDPKSGRAAVVIDRPGAQLGECSLDALGEWLVVAMKTGSRSGLLVVRTDGSGAHEIAFPRTVIHPQFHPLEPEWIEFSGDPAPRMHRVRRDGSGLACLYEHGNDEFVVHETFLGQTGDIVFTVWPRALCRMDWTTREIHTIAEFNAWHITPNRAGSQILCDTNHPDLGMFLIDAATGSRRQVCLSASSNQGTQWKQSRYALAADFAQARAEALSWMEMPIDTVYGPQWTHPHPAFSRDERWISFGSDRTGTTQVYVVGA